MHVNVSLKKYSQERYKIKYKYQIGDTVVYKKGNDYKFGFIQGANNIWHEDKVSLYYQIIDQELEQILVEEDHIARHYPIITLEVMLDYDRSQKSLDAVLL